MEGREEDEDIEDKKVSISFYELAQKGTRMDSILKDLLDLPLRNIAGILHHPVMMLYIEKRWQKTKWMFLVSFLLYIAFLFMFSTFLGLMYFRVQEAKETITKNFLPFYPNATKENLCILREERAKVSNQMTLLMHLESFPAPRQPTS